MMHAEAIQPRRIRKNWEDAAAAAEKAHAIKVRRRSEARSNAAASQSGQMRRALQLALSGYGADAVARMSGVPLKIAYLLVTGDDR